MQTCFGIDYVSPSTAWADIVKGPPAAASLAHTARILNWNAARAAAASDGAATPTPTMPTPTMPTPTMTAPIRRAA